ncbi:hypothetical protein R6Q57_018921 [Mikania cordata]
MMTMKKPEAYEPQQIGLGPIHHFQPRPYKKMERKKFDIMRKESDGKKHQYVLGIRLEKFPKDEIVKAYEKTISILETFTQTKPIIPSASRLHAAGFRFYSLEEDKGIQKIYVWEKEVYLPVFTLNKDSDVIIRNLVAYESLTSKSNSFLLAEFMVLMCALVVNVDDVQKLENVIKGDLPADEVVKLFTGMSGSISAMKSTEKSNFQETIDDIDNVYNSRLRMKTYLFMKKLAQWLPVGLKAIGRFVGSSWKIVTFVAGLVTMFLLTLQAYCDVYGCNKTVTLLPFELLS